MNPFESDDEDNKPPVPLSLPEEVRNIGDGGSFDKEDGGEEDEPAESQTPQQLLAANVLRMIVQ